MNKSLWREQRDIIYAGRRPVNPNDEWSDLRPPLTQEQMQRAADLTRQIMAEDYPRFAAAELTCERCLAATTCPLAFDSYNFDGDCIMEK